MNQSRVTSLLNIQYLVIQAAMTWLTSAEFVAAVSEAGGLGVLGPNAGRTEKLVDPVEVAENMRQQIQKVRTLTNKPFAVNFLFPVTGDELSFKYADLILDVLCEEKVDAVVAVSYDGQPDLEYIHKFKESGIKVLYRDISPTVEGALAAEKAGVDALIVTGHEAGGHLSHHRISTLALLPQVTDTVHIPVIAAGGIYNAKTAKAAFAMGAEAVYMGTRFINTYECPAHEFCKQEIIKVNSEQLWEISESFGRIRVIPNDNINNKEPKAVGFYLDGFRKGMQQGDIDNGFICISESVGGIHNIVSCKELIMEVMAE